MELLTLTNPEPIALFTPPPDHIVLPSAAVVEWAVRINSAWAQGTASTLELAKVVHEARCKLAYGEWTRLWNSDCVRFSKRRADMLLRVATSFADLDGKSISHLPAGWSILYQLALLNRATLQREIEAATIHPGIT